MIDPVNNNQVVNETLAKLYEGLSNEELQNLCSGLLALFTTNLTASTLTMTGYKILYDANPPSPKDINGQRIVYAIEWMIKHGPEVAEARRAALERN